MSRSALTECLVIAADMGCTAEKEQGASSQKTGNTAKVLKAIKEIFDMADADNRCASAILLRRTHAAHGMRSMLGTMLELPHSMALRHSTTIL